MATEQIKRVLILPDLHVPLQDDASLRAVEKYALEHSWWQIGYLGDFMDYAQFSHYRKGAEFAPEFLNTLQHDAAIGNALLDRHAKIKAEKRWCLEGNHDYRGVQISHSIPQFKGVAEIDNVLNFQQRKIEYVRSWSEGESKIIGNAYFIHGFYANEMHAKKHVQTFGTSVFYGHLHDFQEYPLVMRGNDKTLVGKSLGCLCRYDQPYLQGRPTKWQQGFAVFYFFPDGFYNFYPVHIFKNRFVSPEGKIYDGKLIK